MKAFRLPVRLALLFIVLIILSLAVSTTAFAGDAPSSLARPEAPKPALGGGGPVPGGPAYVGISSVEFQPYSETDIPERIGTILYNPNGYNAYFTAAVHLPNNVVITQMVVYFKVIDDTKNLNVRLIKQPFFADFGAVISDTDTSGAAATGSVTYNANDWISDPIVDLASNNYLIQVVLPPSSSVGLSAVRIDYAYQNELPLISK